MKPRTMNMKIGTAISVAVACSVLFGCATKGGWPCWAWQKNTDQKTERWAEAQQKKKADLLGALKSRDTETLDLVVVGRGLVRKYGNADAEKIVLEAWAEFTSQPAQKAGDVMWLVSQTPRVRDLAWLVHYRAEWLSH